MNKQIVVNSIASVILLTLIFMVYDFIEENKYKPSINEIFITDVKNGNLSAVQLTLQTLNMNYQGCPELIIGKC